MIVLDRCGKVCYCSFEEKSSHHYEQTESDDMTKFNKAELRDKIYACWLGKNIGGTLGTPFEGKREVLDVTGFNSEPAGPSASST